MIKKCIKCLQEKEECLDNFAYRKDTKKFNNTCRMCLAKKSLDWYHGNKQRALDYGKQYYAENKEEVQKTHNAYYAEHKEEKNQYYEEHKEEIIEYQKQYREENKEKIAEQKRIYVVENRDKVNQRASNYTKKRSAEDPAFKLRKIMSFQIRAMLKSSNGSKKGKSILYYLEFSIEELKQHIENQFPLPENLDHNGKVWMTWENWGKYNRKIWDDNDSSTWTWQLDHRIPHSDLPYDSMDHPNFKKAWALENLRPLSAKQNVLDGIKRTRHKKKPK